MLVGIHPPLIPYKFPCSIPAHRLPHYHDVPTPKIPLFSGPCSINPSPTQFPTHCFPSDPILLVLVPYNQITLFQSSTAHSAACSNTLWLAPVFSSSSQPWMTVFSLHFWQFVERLCGHWWCPCVGWPEQHWQLSQFWFWCGLIGYWSEKGCIEGICQLWGCSWRTLDIIELPRTSLEAIWHVWRACHHKGPVKSVWQN